MKDEYIEGLQFGIDQFEQAVKDHVEELGAQQHAGAAATVRAHLRGSMRAYAEIVGSLKTEAMAARGEATEVRQQQFKAYVQAGAKADAIQDELESTLSPTQRTKLAIEWEAAERQADALIVAYALP